MTTETTQEAEKEVSWRAIADDLAEAIRLTREYVEPKVALPPIPGWSWHDAMCRYTEAVSASAVVSPAAAPTERSGTATGPAEGNWRERAERAEAQLAAIAEHRNAACAALRIMESTARQYHRDPATADRYRTAREALEGVGGEGGTAPLRTSGQWAVAWGSEDATEARVEFYDDEEDAAEHLGLYGDGAYVVSREVHWGPWRRILAITGTGEEAGRD